MKLIIHIGLHKTGTTSLQHSCFSGLETFDFSDRSFELGYNSIYDLLCRYVFYSQDSVFDSLERKLKCSGKNVLISEEWLSSSYNGFQGYGVASWRSNLTRLSMFASRSTVETVVVITFRDPVAGALSHFFEFKKNVVSFRNCNFDDFCKSEEFGVYNYEELLIFLRGLKIQPVIIKFDKDNISDFEQEWSQLLGEKIILSENLNSNYIVDNQEFFEFLPTFVIYLRKIALIRRCARILKKWFPALIRFFYKRGTIHRDVNLPNDFLLESKRYYYEEM